MKRLIILICLIFMLNPVHAAAAVKDESLKAAFIRDNDLWIKTGDEEEQITTDNFIRFPKWSYDGTKLAYLRTTNKNDAFQGDLWIYDTRKQKQQKVHSGVNANYRWAPGKNEVAFLKEDHLYVTHHTYKSKKISAGIINFSWYPEGDKILVSKKADKGLQSDIQLSTLKLLKNKQVKSKPLYKIDLRKKDNYYGTSGFKWSQDNKWIAFQITPTASLSADSNTLSIISSEGTHFKKLGQMLNYENWFAWAPATERLGFIKGRNRIATLNKTFETENIKKDKGDNFTPNGYADRDFVWLSDEEVIVSRSVESELVNVSNRPLPSLYLINIPTAEGKKLTKPAEGTGDFHPAVQQDKLIWVRTDRQTAEVMTGNVDGSQEETWINNMDLGTWYYEYWYWDEVFALYQHSKK